MGLLRDRSVAESIARTERARREREREQSDREERAYLATLRERGLSERAIFRYYLA